MNRLLHSNRLVGRRSGDTVPGITADGQSRDGRGFRAQGVLTEGYRGPAGVSREGTLAIGPAALGTREDSDRIFGFASGFRRESAQEPSSAGLFFEEVAIARVIRQCRGEFGWRGDLRRSHSPGLLAALARDFSPTLDAFGGRGG